MMAATLFEILLNIKFSLNFSAIIQALDLSADEKKKKRFASGGKHEFKGICVAAIEIEFG